MPAKGHRKHHCLALDLARAAVGREYKFFFAVGVELSDIVQNVALRLLECERNYDPAKGASLVTYLYACAYWLTKRQKTMARKRFELVMRRHDLDLDKMPATKNILCDVDMGEAVSFALASITPRQRKIIMRRARGELLSEIGADLGLTNERIRQIEAKGLGYAQAAARKEAVRVGSTFKECWL